MKIRVYCNAFPVFTIDNVDISTLAVRGPTNGYDDSTDRRDYTTIGFVAENAIEQVKRIRETFQLNPEYSKPEDYIWVREEFGDWENDKRPRIGIKLKSGLRGLTNPPEFDIKAD